MSALGRLFGDAETILRALLDTLGPEATLMAYRAGRTSRTTTWVYGRGAEADP
jgi:hypothetical protein